MTGKYSADGIWIASATGAEVDIFNNSLKVTSSLNAARGINVYAGGDIVTGGATVILAMGAGAAWGKMIFSPDLGAADEAKEGVAASAAAKSAWHVAPQVMPAGALVTVPVPVPAFVTARRWFAARTTSVTDLVAAAPT